ncbi:uncharacterized protein H6S33_011785 [Morchella sextelata]|uniref:uncharacterized protein n=1 Tax=Morchella sextelata TaxID=1174677 RepID=UPI001D0587C5|nr:uncharacterized protein H6S33_011785 [Morchella sextelata]KAH0610258.1 hypothetical protein H6S33_011785 [Morchella sextelata]
MKLTKISWFIALSLLPTLALAIKCPPDLYKNNRYLGGCKDMTNSWIVKDFLCETHAGSPLSKDVLEASNVLRGRGKGDAQCSPETQGENQCVKLVTHLLAGVAVCGMGEMRGVDCVRIANFVWRLEGKCKQTFEGEEEPRVGGRVVFEWGRILVF